MDQPAPIVNQVNNTPSVNATNNNVPQENGQENGFGRNNKIYIVVAMALLIVATAAFLLYSKYVSNNTNTVLLQDVPNSSSTPSDTSSSGSVNTDSTANVDVSSGINDSSDTQLDKDIQAIENDLNKVEENAKAVDQSINIQAPQELNQ